MSPARLCASILLVTASFGCTRAPARFLYVANFGSDDISVYTVDSASGVLGAVRGSPFAAGRGPRAVAVAPSRRFAYVVNHGSSDVSVYRIDAKSGRLTPVAGSPFASGDAPRDVVVTPSGRYLYVVCAGPRRYDQTVGSIAAYAIHSETGALSPLVGSPMPAMGSPSAVAMTPSGNVLFVTSGFAIAAYTADGATGALTPVPGSPFSTGTRDFVVDGPRSPLTGESLGPPVTLNIPYLVNSLAVAPSGHVVYAAVSAILVPPPGAVSVGGLAPPLPRAPSGPAGPRLVSAVSAFWIDAASGALTPIAGAPWPSGTNALAVTSARNGRFVYVANYTSRDIWGYSVDATGELRPLSGSPFQLEKPPSIVLAEPSGFLYVTHGAGSTNGAGVVAAYAIDPATGALIPVRGGPFPAGSKPSALAITPR